jgi:formyl-CoA transferase
VSVAFVVVFGWAGGERIMERLPLSGVRVVDLTRVMAGPYCTMLLGDLGADVIKIERPGTGDDTRAWGPPFIHGVSAYYLSVNRNKRSITLDLKHPAGQEVFWRLVDRADVVVENFSPGTVDRLGIGYQAVRGRRPQIIYCSISGFGQTGPGKDRTAYDLIVQGMSGLMSVTGFPEGEPVRFGVPIADIGAGMFAALAIVAALYHRAQTGEGQYIDTSMLGGQVALLTYQAGIYFATGEAPKRTGMRIRSSRPTRCSAVLMDMSISRQGTMRSSRACAGRSGWTICSRTSDSRPMLAGSPTCRSWSSGSSR